MKTLCLASTSPRRQELLKRLGVPFTVAAPKFEETPTGLPALEECRFFAEEKARSVFTDHPGCWILGADTLIECEGEKVGKPEDAEDAFRILKKLSGRMHSVHTAIALLDPVTGRLLSAVETARVTFRTMSDKEILDYIATGEPLGKAGAYAVQGRARKLFIQNVEGDEEAVIGLPVALVKLWLRKVGLI